jgi:hypothetical protein
MPELPPPAVIAQAVARVASPGYEQWDRAMHAAGCCVHPVRLAGTVLSVDTTTGEARTVVDTRDDPTGVLLTACRTRRATRCPACAMTYQGDARALVIAGLAGGKGMPDSIGEHPAVFATFTAPSFGAVHRVSDRPCHPPRPACECRKASRAQCNARHALTDPLVGTPLCTRCYDYAGTVIWNNRVTVLWVRTCIGIHRALAQVSGSTVRAFAVSHRLSFVKVVEYQRRGVVHVHAALRIDRADGTPPAISAEAFAKAVVVAARRAKAPNPYRRAQPIVWGQELAVAEVGTDQRMAAANYLAKYATKSTDDSGALDHRLRHGDTSTLPVPEHLRHLVEVAWQLGGRPDLAALNLRPWAHTLGYRGTG